MIFIGLILVKKLPMTTKIHHCTSTIGGLLILNTNGFIVNLWNRFENYDENLPVVDSKGKFRGVLSKDDMISVLAS